MAKTFTATIQWERNGATFADNRYSRVHEWTFDGGVVVPASASPSSVPPPFSSPNAVDPEEALVAATSSCHMLWFLWLAAQEGLIVESYKDHAHGILGSDETGTIRFTRIALRPQIQFQGTQPTPQQLQQLHHAAHKACYIANTLQCPVIVEDAGELGA